MNCIVLVLDLRNVQTVAVNSKFMHGNGIDIPLLNIWLLLLDINYNVRLCAQKQSHVS